MECPTPRAAAHAWMHGVGVDAVRPVCDASAVPHASRQCRPVTESPGPPKLSPGIVVGDRFVVSSPLGGGGFGDVYACEDTLTGQPAALKVLRIEGAGYRVAWRRELAMLRLFEAPGVVTLIDEGVVDGLPYVAMPLVDGGKFPGTVRDRSWDSIRLPVVTLLSALHYVHAAGIVHRDLKPSNVLVDAAGHAHVLDFGIAWDRSAAAEELFGLGTPAFTSPEQARGAVGDHRSDIYAVGTMIWEALTGAWPFAADSVKQLLTLKCTQRAPSLASVCPDAPREVVRAVDAMLTLEPHHRPGSAIEVLAMLASSSDALEPMHSWLAHAGELRSASDLEPLFAGPERIMRFRSRGAAVLWKAAGDHRNLLLSTVERWLREGLVWWSNGRLALSERTLGRMTGLGLELERYADPARMMLEVTHGGDASTPVGISPYWQDTTGEEDTIAATDAPVATSSNVTVPEKSSSWSSMSETLVTAALAACDASAGMRSVLLADAAVDLADSEPARIDALVALSYVALRCKRVDALDLALYRLGMVEGDAVAASAERLIRIARLYAVGMARRMREDLESIERPQHPLLLDMLARLSAVADLAATAPHDASAVEARWRARHGDALDAGTREFLAGNFRYLAGDYEDAASRAYAYGQTLPGDASDSVLLIAAVHWMEAGNGRQAAAAIAETRKVDALPVELALLRVGLELSLQYRSFQQVRCDDELLEILLEHAPQFIRNMVSATLLGAALRAGDRRQVERVANSMMSSAEHGARAIAGHTARAALLHVQETPDPLSVATLLGEVLDVPFPRARLQCIAMLWRHLSASARERAQVAFEAAWVESRAAEFSMRFEVFSPQECRFLVLTPPRSRGSA